MSEYKGNLDASGLRIFAVVARFNELVTQSLLFGAREMFTRLGGRPEDFHVAFVPGSFELPLVAAKLAERDDLDAVVALGAVIRGATPHFEYLSQQAASGLMRAMLDTGKPVIFGVLTTDSIDQALERAGIKAGNKGADAIMSAVETVRLLRQL